MTDEEIQEFLDMFKTIPDPEHYPRCFAWYVRLYLHNKERQNNER
jgi:hypothetical protein|tara:strand:- start:41 stop:175 length:135 start_codon:yes stop_codon:yes gene_type:complete